VPFELKYYILIYKSSILRDVSMMTVVTRSGRECSVDGVPRGWKIISARVGAAVSTFYISPHGKRFSSLDAVKRYVEKFPQVALLSTRRRKRSEEFEISKPAKRFKLMDGTSAAAENAAPVTPQRGIGGAPPPSDEQAVELSETVKRRRKLLALRSPFRNLLKKTLVRNQQNTRQRTQSALF